MQITMIRSSKITSPPPPPVPPRPSKTIIAEALAKSRKVSPIRALYASAVDVPHKPVVPVRAAPPPPLIKPKPNGQIAQPQVCKSYSAAAIVFNPQKLRHQKTEVLRSVSDVNSDFVNKPRTIVYQSSNCLKTSKIEVNLTRRPSGNNKLNPTASSVIETPKVVPKNKTEEDVDEWNILNINSTASSIIETAKTSIVPETKTRRPSGNNKLNPTASSVIETPKVVPQNKTEEVVDEWNKININLTASSIIETAKNVPRSKTETVNEFNINSTASSIIETAKIVPRSKTEAVGVDVDERNKFNTNSTSSSIIETPIPRNKTEAVDVDKRNEFNINPTASFSIETSIVPRNKTEAVDVDERNEFNINSTASSIIVTPKIGPPNKTEDDVAPEINPIDKVIDVIIQDKKLSETIVQSSDKTTIIVTDDDANNNTNKKVQFDDKINHEILISELQTMKEEQEKFLKRQRKPPIDIYDCDSESVNSEVTRIQHSDWIEVANNGEEVRLSSCQIYIDNSDESSSKSSTFSSCSSSRKQPQRVPSMSSLHGLPPLPKSLSGFNLLDATSVHRVETPRGSYHRVVSASPGPQTPSRAGSSRGATPPTPGSGTGHVVYPPHPRVNGTNEIPRGRKITTLDTQLAVLRREMYGLRQLDLSLLSQLYSLNEAIQDFRQILQDQEDSALSPHSPSPSPSSGGEGDEFYSPTPLRYKPAPPAPPLRRTSNSSSANSSEYGTV